MEVFVGISLVLGAQVGFLALNRMKIGILFALE
jgi:hypothetical protein